MSPTIVIPARWGSSRFPGKPLACVAGAPLIQQVCTAALRTGLRVVVATDDERIRMAGLMAGTEAVMTPECANGTERCAEVARMLGLRGPVINWQGDSPLVPAAWIDALLQTLEEAPGCGAATPVQRCSAVQARRIRDDAAAGRPGGTTAVLDQQNRALYFSKAPIPYRGPLWFHIGIYAYTAEALARYGREPGQLETAEQLEQLRFLERGIPVQAMVVDGPEIWEVNSPDDVRVVEGLMGERDAALRT